MGTRKIGLEWQTQAEEGDAEAELLKMKELANVCAHQIKALNEALSVNSPHFLFNGAIAGFYLK